MKWYLSALKKYAVFSGRARRKEYWTFVLFNMIFAIVARIIDTVLRNCIFVEVYYRSVALETDLSQVQRMVDGFFGFFYRHLYGGPIYIIYVLAILLPGLSVAVRRLHDVGKGWWYLFISLIPIAGPIWLLVLMCSDGTPGENQFGLNPKEKA